MFKKTSVSTLTPATIMDDDARRAAAIREAKKTFIKFVIIKATVTVAIGVAAGIAMKVLEAGAEEIIED